MEEGMRLLIRRLEGEDMSFPCREFGSLKRRLARHMGWRRSPLYPTREDGL